MKTLLFLSSSFVGNAFSSIRSSKEKQSLVYNFIYMALLQGANYLLPLITVPYIARTISPESFGLVSYAQAFISYTSLCVNYGFDFTATRDIASHKVNSKILSLIFSKVITAKVLLFGLCTAVFIPLIFFVPRFSQDYSIYLLTYLINIGYILMPSWYFQGIGKLNYIAILNLIIKLIFTALIFILVKEGNDYYWIPLSTSIGQIFVGIVSFVFVVNKYKLNFYIISFSKIAVYLKEASPVFASTVAISFYTTTNLVILGFLANDTLVGLYAASSKIVVIIASALMFPVSLTLFPYIGAKLRGSLLEGHKVLIKFIYLVGSLSLLLSIFIFTFSSEIIEIVFGSQYTSAAESLKVLSCIPFIVSLNNLFGTQGLLNLKKDRQFLYVTICGSTLSVVLNFVLIPFLNEIGAAITWVITEVFITICFALLYFKAFKNFSLKKCTTI